MNLKSGKNSTEFWALVGLGVMVVFGLIKPDTASTALTSGASPMQTVLETIQNLAQSKGEIGIYALIVWAYIKRRSALKGKAIDKGA